MTHSPAFNEARRLAYAEGRRLGLSPRDAGHLYGPAFVERVRATKASDRGTLTKGSVPEVLLEGTAAERNEIHRKKMVERLGHDVTTRQATEEYRAHNRALIETKVRLLLRQTDTGERFHRTITLLSAEPLTRQEALDQSSAFVDKNSIRAHGVNSPPATIVGLTFLEERRYPEIAY